MKVDCGAGDRLLREVLQAHGFETDWDGNVKTRIQIRRFDWQRRS